jgi:hypothetical protein
MLVMLVFCALLGELAAAGRAEQLQMAIARHHAAARPDQLGFFYIDGHAKGGYFGTRDVQKMHVARLKFPAPGTEETWVTDGAGDPLLVVMAQPSSSLASQIRGLLPQPRGIAGQDRKVTLCFDRGGWSPTCSPTSSTPGSTCSPTARMTPAKTPPPCRRSLHPGRLGRRRRLPAPVRPRRHHSGAGHQQGQAHGPRAGAAAGHSPQA